MSLASRNTKGMIDHLQIHGITAETVRLEKSQSKQNNDDVESGDEYDELNDDASSESSNETSEATDTLVSGINNSYLFNFSYFIAFLVLLGKL